jgi:hypothetical protein
MKCLPLVIVLVLASGLIRADESAKLVKVQKIWDQAPHNAFTDLVRFQDRWFCVFREGQGHVSPDGALRVITSADGSYQMFAEIPSGRRIWVIWRYDREDDEIPDVFGEVGGAPIFVITAY